MKTLKLITLLTALIFAVSSISAIATESKTNAARKAVDMSLEKAIQNPSLVIIMHRQLDNGFLIYDQETITKSVYYHSYIIRITGTYDQWEAFFSPLHEVASGRLSTLKLKNNNNH